MTANQTIDFLTYSEITIRKKNTAFEGMWLTKIYYDMYKLY